MATGLAELGVDEGIISRILNHSISAGGGARITAQVYNQYGYLQPMRDALQAWGDRLDEILTSPQREKVVALQTKRKERQDPTGLAGSVPYL